MVAVNLWHAPSFSPTHKAEVLWHMEQLRNSSRYKAKIKRIQQQEKIPGNVSRENQTFDKQPIEVVVPVEEAVSQEYRRIRVDNFDSWFVNGTTLRVNADKDGPIIDFAVVGFPKCGTTTVEANLGQIAPLPIGDICTPVHQTIYYAYKNWPKKYGSESKVLRGTKCPAFIDGAWLKEWSLYLPKTKLILGIRHPVLWFQSFWNMLTGNEYSKFSNIDPYNITEPCNSKRGGCRGDCPARQVFCTQRASFHVALARLGKTELSTEERQLLSAKTYPIGGGMNLQSHNISNSIFVYEMTELNKDYVWDEMAKYLQYPNDIPNSIYKGSHGKNKTKAINICDQKFDDLRALLMPESYDLSTWLLKYFIPLSKDPNRNDVVIPRPENFRNLVEAYKFDPCKRLIRLENGTFVLKESISTTQ